MTGKGSSSCPVIFYWKEITLCEGCSAVFNGLIASEKAATGNAVTRGKYHSETLSATRESQRISLMGGGERSCVGCQILSILHRFSVYSPPPPPLPPPRRIISLSAPLQSSITPRAISQAPRLENKLIFTPSLLTPPQKTPLVHLCPSIAVFV